MWRKLTTVLQWQEFFSHSREEGQEKSTEHLSKEILIFKAVSTGNDFVEEKSDKYISQKDCLGWFFSSSNGPQSCYICTNILEHVCLYICVYIMYIYKYPNREEMNQERGLGPQEEKSVEWGEIALNIPHYSHEDLIFVFQ